SWMTELMIRIFHAREEVWFVLRTVLHRLIHVISRQLSASARVVWMAVRDVQNSFLRFGHEVEAFQKVCGGRSCMLAAIRMSLVAFAPQRMLFSISGAFLVSRCFFAVRSMNPSRQSQSVRQPSRTCCRWSNAWMEICDGL